jgi:hypothetical protein
MDDVLAKALKKNPFHGRTAGRKARKAGKAARPGAAVPRVRKNQ